MSGIENQLPHLVQYLTQTNAAALAQFVMFAIILGCLAERTLRALGWLGEPLHADEPITNRVIEELTRLCFAMGLLLTFSGLYAYLGSSGSRDSWSLLLALGSSAIGYSSWTACAVGGVFDSLRGIAAHDASEPARQLEAAGPPKPHHPAATPPPRFQRATPVGTEPADPRAATSSRSAGGSQARHVSDEAVLEYLEASEEHSEQEPVIDSDSGSRHLGGAVHHATGTDGSPLGSLDRYQRPEPDRHAVGSRADSDLD